MIFDPMDESDSSGDEGGLVTRRQTERLNMPQGPIGMIRDQIEADKEFTEKIWEAEKAGVATPVEVPGDAEYAQRLHEEINEPSQLAGELGGDVTTREGEVDEPATSSRTKSGR